jgi:hypothetical protein
LFAGDAAHAMGPSAGAGMMIGLLGAWRLGWRLALAAGGHAQSNRLLDDYAREQRAGAEAIQKANAFIFRNMALSSPIMAWSRTQVLSAAGAIPGMSRKMAETEALLRQRLPVAPSDAPVLARWPMIERLGGTWIRGERAPASNCLLQQIGDGHLLVPIGRPSDSSFQALRSALEACLPTVPEVWRPDVGQDDTVSDQRAGRSAVAVVRPDQHVVGIYQL